MAARLPRWSSSLLLTGAIAAVGLLSIWSRLGRGVDIWLPDLATGITLAIAGAVITALNARTRLGLIVQLAAVAWFLPNFRTSDIAPLAALAAATTLLHRAVLFHAVVAFPGGRVARSSEGLIVVLAYASVLPVLAVTGASAIVWSVLALSAFVAIVTTRPGPAREAGVRVLPTMGLLALVVGGTSVLFLLAGNAPGPAPIVHTYEAGIAAVGVVLTVTVVRYRSGLAGLTAAAVELAQGQAGYVRGLLATALHDPTVEVAFAVDGTGATTWVDELGQPVDALTTSGTRTVIPVVVDGRVVAELACDSAVAEEPAVRRSIETAARLAASNASLRAGLRTEAEQLRASQLRLLSAADEQRMALARQLAVGAEASLTEIAPLLDAVPDDADAAVGAAVERSRARSDGLAADLRSLAAGLGPADLQHAGLERSLSRLGAGFDGRLDLQIDAADLPERLAAAIYFICAEGIANAIKHANASEVCVRIVRRGEQVLVSIVDDGVGGASAATGSGLRGLADRASALGGSISIDSSAAAGTRLSVNLPLR